MTRFMCMSFFAGDVNGDHVDDLVIGVLRTTDRFRGGAYVLYGRDRNHTTITNSDSAVYLNEWNTNSSSSGGSSFGTNMAGFEVHGIPWSWTGFSVSIAGVYVM